MTKTKDFIIKLIDALYEEKTVIVGFDGPFTFTYTFNNDEVDTYHVDNESIVLYGNGFDISIPIKDITDDDIYFNENNNSYIISGFGGKLYIDFI